MSYGASPVGLIFSFSVVLIDYLTAMLSKYLILNLSRSQITGQNLAGKGDN